MIHAIQYAREKKVPYFGICLGMQTALIEYARNVAGLADADSTEFNAETPHKIFVMLHDLKGITNMGGTMRLGAYPCDLTPGSLAARIYNSDKISERHRHRYEFNRDYESQLMELGMHFSGYSPDKTFAEIIELPDHPWFLGCQFHPEYKSKPLVAHPLFKSFIAASLENKLKKIDDNGNTLLSTPDLRMVFSESFSPEKIIDYNGYVYLYNKSKGCKIFDYYGALKQSIPLLNQNHIQVIKNSILGFDDNALHVYDIPVFTEHSYLLDPQMKDALKLQKLLSNVFVLKPDGLHLYTISN